MVKLIDNQRSPNDRIEIDNITLDENTISSQIGNLILNPASDIDCSNKNLINVGGLSITNDTGSITTDGAINAGSIASGALTITGVSSSLTDHTPIALFTTSTTEGDADSSICIKSRADGESTLFLTNDQNGDHKTWAMYLEKVSGNLRFNYGTGDPLTGAIGDDNKLTISPGGFVGILDAALHSPECALHIKASVLTSFDRTTALVENIYPGGQSRMIVSARGSGDSHLILKNSRSSTSFFDYGIVHDGGNNSNGNDNKLHFTYGASSTTTGVGRDKTLMVMNAANNRIGINNTDPAYSLDVTGNIRATEEFISTSETPSTSTSTGSIVTAGGLGVGGAINAGSITSGGLNLNGNLNVVDSRVLIYNDNVTGVKTAESCLHIICNENAGPLIVEERTGTGGKLKIELRPKIAEIYGGITVKGQSSDVQCDMIDWDAGSGGGRINLGKLRFNLLKFNVEQNQFIQENQVEITTSSVSIKKSLSVIGGITGTLGTPIQPNVTSLGTLINLKVDDLTLDGNTISSNDNTDINITPHGTGTIIAGKNITCPALTLSSGSALSIFSEGNWSPNISSIQIITGTPAYENCRYMRINNNVYLQGRITGYSYQASVDGTRCIFVFDLPFPAISNPAHAVGTVTIVDNDGGERSDTDIGVIVDATITNATQQAALWNRRVPGIDSLIQIAISLSVNYICA